MSFSFASGSASRKVCIGVLPNHGTYYLGLLAQTYERADQTDEALDLVETALVAKVALVSPVPMSPAQRTAALGSNPVVRSRLQE